MRELQLKSTIPEGDTNFKTVNILHQGRNIHHVILKNHNGESQITHDFMLLAIRNSSLFMILQQNDGKEHISAQDVITNHLHIVSTNQGEGDEL